jgi:hypothetical protein
MIKWIYSEDYNLEDYLGFVYRITNLTNGKFYIGTFSNFIIFIINNILWN